MIAVPDLKDKSILYIEDDYVNYLYFKDLLLATHINLRRAINLKQALHILTVSSDINLIALSLTLTDNINNVVLEYIRAKYPYLPLILINSTNIDLTNINTLKSRYDTCINLHTDSSHLIEAIQEMLSFRYYPNDLKY